MSHGPRRSSGSREPVQPRRRIPGFLFLTPGHQEALAQLLYGVEQHKGFILLTGEVGTGKTTLLQALLERLDSTTAVAFVTNSMLAFEGILEYVQSDLGIAKPGESSLAQRLIALQNFLIERRRSGPEHRPHPRRGPEPRPRDARAGPAALQLRDDDREDPADRAGRPARALGQARPARAPPAQAADRAPLPHPSPHARPGPRLHPNAAPDRGCARPRRSSRARPSRRIARARGGIPRLVNTLCDHCLLIAYADQIRRIERGIVEETIRYLDDGDRTRR